MKKILLLTVLILSFGFSIHINAQCDSTLPITENFDSNVVNVCWDVMDEDGDNNNWYWWEYSPTYGGHKVIASNSFYTSTGALTPDNWIISHSIDLTSFDSSDNIELSWKVRGELSGFSHEFYTIYAATGNSTSAFQASSVKRGEYVDEVGGNGTFTSRDLDLSSLAGNVIYVAFRHHNSTNQYNINIDEVTVEAVSGSLSSEEFETKNFKHYYNKGNDVLTLKSSTSAINKVSIYNLLGKRVLSDDANNTHKEINLASLTNGVYIAQVEINNTSKAIKFIKH